MLVGLIGYRGSGKTTTGQALAARLGLAHVDADARIIERAGMNIREIFARQGETAFRDLESDVVREAAALDGAVVSFGGGAMDREINRQVIAKAGVVLVYLRCEPEELLRRIEADPKTAANRPNLTALAGGLAEINALLARREPIWRSIASIEIDVTRMSTDEVVEELPGRLPLSLPR